MPPDTIDGISTAELIKAFNITVHIIDERSLPPKGYYKAWSSQFLLIDILRQMKDYVLPDDRVVILDSDVIFTKPVAEDFFQDIDKHYSLLYTIDYPSDKPVKEYHSTSFAKWWETFQQWIRISCIVKAVNLSALKA